MACCRATQDSDDVLIDCAALFGRRWRSGTGAMGGAAELLALAGAAAFAFRFRASSSSISCTVRRTLVWGCWDPLDDVIAVPDSGEAYGENPVADAISDWFWQRIRLITCVWSGIRTPCTLVNGKWPFKPDSRDHTVDAMRSVLFLLPRVKRCYRSSALAQTRREDFVPASFGLAKMGMSLKGGLLEPA